MENLFKIIEELLFDFTDSDIPVTFVKELVKEPSIDDEFSVKVKRILKISIGCYTDTFNIYDYKCVLNNLLDYLESEGHQLAKNTVQIKNKYLNKWDELGVTVVERGDVYNGIFTEFGDSYFNLDRIRTIINSDPVSLYKKTKVLIFFIELND